MAVTKKIRFEVFKRDGFRCAYCGKSPPDVLLEIDHIKPRKRKGTDDINNLLTACFDCNRGKSATSLKKAPQQLVDNLAVLREKEEQFVAYQKLVRKIERRIQRQVKSIDLIFSEHFEKSCLTESFKRCSVKLFVKRLPLPEVEDAMYISCERFDVPDRVVKYFCGICWKKIRARECPGDSL